MGVMAQKDYEQKARIALLNEYSSNKRSWGVNALTFVIAILAVLQISKEINWKMIFLISFLLSQVIYSFFRYNYFGQMSKWSIRSAPKIDFTENGTQTYLSQLDYGIISDFKNTFLGKICHRFHDIKGWILMTFPLTVVLIISSPIFI